MEKVVESRTRSHQSETKVLDRISAFAGLSHHSVSENTLCTKHTFSLPSNTTTFSQKQIIELLIY
jgi:hypothetical protein